MKKALDDSKAKFKNVAKDFDACKAGFIKQFEMFSSCQQDLNQQIEHMYSEDDPVACIICH